MGNTNQRRNLFNMRYSKKHLVVIIISMLFLSIQALHAQERSLSGKVIDELGEPMIGVNVLLVGSNKGVATDIDGKYSIKIPEKGAVIKFSYVSYKTKVINVVGNKATLDVIMEDDAVMLQQQVVTAMDLRRDEKSLSTAFQKIDPEGMTENRDAGFVNMLAGKIAGLQVISNGPSGSATVRIRGANSITGNNQPLYIIDGVPIINDLSDGELDYGNPANSINPDDIEGIVVLKGANASALYGSDAANGAILITTKKPANKNGMGISVSSNIQFTKLLQYPIYQNVYGSGQLTALKNNNANTFANDLKIAYDPNLQYGINRLGGDYNNRSNGMPMLGFDIVGRNGEVKSYSPTSNNITSMYQTAQTFTNSISIDKSSEFVSARLGYTNVRSDDVLAGQNKMNRNMFNLRTTVKPAKFLDIDMNARYTHERTDNRSYRNDSGYNPLYLIAWMPRDMTESELIPWKSGDGTPVSLADFKNPYWMLNELSNQDKKDWLLADATLNFKLTKDLRLRLKAAVDYNSRSGYEYRNMYTPGDSDGYYKEFIETGRNYTFEAMLTYNKRWKGFNISAGLGANSQDQLWKKQNSEVGTLGTPNMISLVNNGATVNSWRDYNNKEKQAIFGTASIGYNDFIYMDVTGRNDWSSALPSDNRSYFYSSVGTSFVLTELVKKIPKDYLSYAKFRLSYAAVGNDTGFDQLLNSYRYGRVYLGDMAWFESDNKRRNPRLKPESTKSIEVGTNLKFWKDRISLDVTYYTKTTKDQILTSKINGVSGYDEAMFNAGEVKNWGTEITLGVVAFKNKDWELSFDLNWAKNNSEVVELAEGMDYMTVKTVHGITELRVVKGQSLGSIYSTKAWKMDNEGHILVDANGRPMETTSKFLGNVSPDWMGGFRTSIRWRDLSASILIDFKKGGKVWSGTSYQGSRDGNTITSLTGRDEYLFSKLVLDENDQKGFLGILDSQYVPWNKLNEYLDAARVKGVIIPNAVFDESVPGKGGQPSYIYVKPEDYWTNDAGKNGALFIYDASYIKLREVSIGYTFPRRIINKIGFLQSMKVSAVGRNVAIFHQKTPKGIDPEATSSMLNNQGLENGFNLPSATYGFDLKITF